MINLVNKKEKYNNSLYNKLNYHTKESIYDYEHKMDPEIYYPFEHNVINFI